MAFVQDVALGATAGTSTQLQLTVGVTTTVGNHLLLGIATGGPAITSITDEKGNSYQQDAVDDGTTSTIRVNSWSAKITSALVSGDKIFINPASTAHMAAVVEEWAGLHATTWLEVGQAQSSAAAMAHDSGATDTGGADRVLWGVFSHVGSSVPSYAPEVVSPVWDARQLTASTVTIRSVKTYSRQIASIQTVAFKGTWTTTNRDQASSIATYILADGGGGTDIYLLESGGTDGYQLEDGSGVLLLEQQSTVVSSSFTADALVRKPQLFSLTANSVIFRAGIAGSLTANAVLKRTQSGSFTANAVVKRTISASLTADAVLKRTQPSSFTANAILKAGIFPFVVDVSSGNDPTDQTSHDVTLPTSQAGDIVLIFLANAPEDVSFNNTGWTGSGGGFPSSGGVASLRVWRRTMLGGDASIVTFTTTLAVKIAYQAITIRDANLYYVSVGTALGASANPDPLNLAVGNDLYLWTVVAAYFDGTQTVSAYPSGYTGGRNDRANVSSGVGVASAYRWLVTTDENPGAFTISASEEWIARAFPFVGAKRVSADAVLRKTRPFSFTADAVISAGATTIPGSFIADAVLKRTQSATFTANADIKRTISASFVADAVTKRTQTGTFTANAVIKRVQSTTFTADAVIKRVQTFSFVADAVVKRTGISASFTANADIRRTGMPGSFFADAVVKKTGIGATFSANAVLKRTISATFIADAVIRRSSSATFVADAITRVPRAGSSTADAIIKRTQFPSAIADAIVKRTGIAFSFAADALIVKRVSSSFTANAVIKAAMPGSFAVDAIKLRTFWFGPESSGF